MRQFLRYIFLFLALVAVFVLAKPLFVLVQSSELRHDVDAALVMQAMLHGLPLDLATTAYLTAPVWIGLGLALWLRLKGWRIVFKTYALVVSAALALILVGDACLYSFWNAKLDATVWSYLAQPQGALQSVSMGYALKATLCTLLVGVVLYYLQTFLFVSPKKEANAQTKDEVKPDETTNVQNKKHSLKIRNVQNKKHSLKIRIAQTVGWAVGCGLLFLLMRGGITQSTANVGMAYFSNNPFLNHAAVNPAFSLLSSTLKQGDYAKLGQFYDEAECARRFAQLHYNTESLDTPCLLRTQRPNVVIILMEGCGGTFVHAVDSLADPNVTPHLNQLAREGVVFTQMYANSFRTDRGTVCALSGCPALPNLSVMKQPSLCEKLPSIARSLKAEGYATSFLYGGDINFTNTRGYLQSTGYDQLTSVDNFPASTRHTHQWGVTDHITFDTLYHRILRLPAQPSASAKPWHIGFLTLASHEPWQVPYHRIASSPEANGMAYLDHCIGEFVARLKQTPQWQNLLLVLLPDHGLGYPSGLDDSQERKSHIPLILTGGAVKEPQRISLICNQTDLPATLLGQLGISHEQFPLSRDVLSRSYTHPSATHAWQEGIYYLDHTGISVLGLNTQPPQPLRESPTPRAQRISAAKALLQTSYRYLDHLRTEPHAQQP